MIRWFGKRGEEFAQVIVGINATSAAAFNDGVDGCAALACSGCHPAGASVQTPVPRLQGRKAADIVEQMQAFREGKRDSTVMDRIAEGFNDPEIKAIADWYAQLR